MENQEGSIEAAAVKLRGLMNTGEPVEKKEATEAPEPTQPDEGEPVAQAAEAEAETQAEEETIDAKQIAEYLKYNPENMAVDDEGNIKFKVKVDGEESDATLSDLVERYQRDAHLTNKGKELAELKKQAELNLTDLLQKGQHMAAQVDAVYETLSKEALARFTNVDWNSLRVNDPAEYAALKAEMQETQLRLQGAKDTAMRSLAEQYQSAQGQVREKMQQYLSEQRDALKFMIPTWGAEAQKDVTHFLNTQGFVDDEVKNIFDARMVNIAYMAMLYNKGKAEVKGKLDQKPLPKVIRPGTKPDSKAIADSEFKKVKAMHKKTGTVQSAAEALKYLMRK